MKREEKARIRELAKDTSIEYADVAKLLNEEGILSPRGLPWTRTNITVYAVKNLKIRRKRKPRASRNRNAGEESGAKVKKAARR